MRRNFELLSDSEIVGMIAAGKEEALAALYDRHAARLYGLALRILKDQSQAEEALQDTFLSVWKNAQRFDKHIGDPLAWMMIMCRNRSIDRLRSKERSRTRSAALSEGSLQIKLEWHAQHPLEAINLDEQRTRVVRAMMKLPDDQRLPIEMAFFDGLTQSEIAHALNLPLGTIKTRIRLGMQKLKSLLQENFAVS